MPDDVKHLVLDVKPHHRGGLGTDAVNGGVLASTFDFAIGVSAALTVPLRRNGTIQLSIAFERAVRGNVARCEASIDRQASSPLFVGARMMNEPGVP